MKNSKIYGCDIKGTNVSTDGSILVESYVGGISNIVDSTIYNCHINDCVLKNCNVKDSILRNAIICGNECYVSLKSGQMACVPKAYKSYAMTVDNDRINILFISDKNVWEFDIIPPADLLMALKFRRK